MLFSYLKMVLHFKNYINLLKKSLVLGIESLSVCFAIQLVKTSKLQTAWNVLTTVALENISPDDPMALYYVIDFRERYNTLLGLINIVVYLARAPKSNINKLAKWRRLLPLSYSEYSCSQILQQALHKQIELATLDNCRYCLECLYESKSSFVENMIEASFNPPHISTGAKRKAPILVWRSFDTVLFEDPYYLKIRHYFLNSIPWRWDNRKNLLLHINIFHLLYYRTYPKSIKELPFNRRLQQRIYYHNRTQDKMESRICRLIKHRCNDYKRDELAEHYYLELKET